MNKNCRKIYLYIFCPLFLAPYFSKAQNFTSSPYSMYGVGELRTQTNAASTAMGNTGIGLSTNKFINLLNPASTSGLDSSNFVFNIGGESKYSRFKTSLKTANAKNANLSYLAMGLRVNNWLSMGLGVNPFSTAGYDINTRATIDGSTYTYPLEIIGSGNISRAYFSFAVVPVKNLSIGVRNSYLFGSLVQTQYHNLAAISSVSVSSEITDYFRNFYWEFGVQYNFDLKQGKQFSVGAIFTPGQHFVTQHEIQTYSTSGLIYDAETENKHDFSIPQEYGLGLVYSSPKMMYLLDAGIQMWSKNDYDDEDFQSVQSVQLEDSPYVRAGVEYTPSKHFLDKYYKKISYRLGYQYSKSYLSLRSYQSRENVVSLGFGLPLNNDRSRIDISIEGGTKGQVGSVKIIKENFIRFRIGFSLIDLWFQQRKYN